MNPVRSCSKLNRDTTVLTLMRTRCSEDTNDARVVLRAHPPETGGPASAQQRFGVHGVDADRYPVKFPPTETPVGRTIQISRPVIER